jgi:hypothetical protein
MQQEDTAPCAVPATWLPVRDTCMCSCLCSSMTGLLGGSPASSISNGGGGFSRCPCRLGLGIDVCHAAALPANCMCICCGGVVCCPDAVLAKDGLRLGGRQQHSGSTGADIPIEGMSHHSLHCHPLAVLAVLVACCGVGTYVSLSKQGECWSPFFHVKYVVATMPSISSATPFGLSCLHAIVPGVAWPCLVLPLLSLCMWLRVP